MEKYFKFDGTATRSEYWAVNLLGFFIAFVVAVFSFILIALGVNNSNFLLALGLFSLAIDCIAIVWLTVATAVRRCHNAGLNPWWVIIMLLPFGSVILGVLKTDEGTR